MVSANKTKSPPNITLTILPDLPCNLPLTLVKPLQQWFSQSVYRLLAQRDPNNQWLQLADLLDFTPLETACTDFHKRKSGRNVPHTVARLSRVLFIKAFLGLSLRQTETSCRYDLQLKRFAGYGLFEMGPDHTTIERFECYVMAQHPRLYFDTFLQQIDQLGGRAQAEQVQYADTFAMCAAASKESIVQMLRHGCRRLLAVSDDSLWLHVDQTRLFGASDAKSWHRLTGVERAQLRLQTVTAVQACCQLVQAETVVSTEQRHWLAFIHKIMVDEYALEHDEQGVLTAVRVLNKKERGSYRHASATDPDASYRVHGKNKIELGYNISVAADDTYIREIRADTGATPDAVPLPKLLSAQQEHHTLLPDRIVYDRAAGSPKTLALVDKATNGATQLVAQLIDHSDTTSLYGPLDFTLADNELALTCPNGLAAQAPHRSGSGDGWNFRFSHIACTGCPLMNRCYKKPATQRYRTVFISDYRRIADRLRLFSQQPLYRFLLRDRAHIERIIAGLVRYNDARVARRRGRAAADFQVKMSAMAFNVKTLLRRQRLAVTQGEMCLAVA